MQLPNKLWSELKKIYFNTKIKKFLDLKVHVFLEGYKNFFTLSFDGKIKVKYT